MSKFLSIKLKERMVWFSWFSDRQMNTGLFFIKHLTVLERYSFWTSVHLYNPITCIWIQGFASVLVLLPSVITKCPTVSNFRQEGFFRMRVWGDLSWWGRSTEEAWGSWSHYIQTRSREQTGSWSELWNLKARSSDVLPQQVSTSSKSHSLHKQYHQLGDQVFKHRNL